MVNWSHRENPLRHNQIELGWRVVYRGKLLENPRFSTSAHGGLLSSTGKMLFPDPLLAPPHLLTTMKILYVITKSNWGGAQRYVFDLATEMKKESDVIVALGGDGALKVNLQKAGIRTISINAFTRDISLVRDLQAFFELFQVIRRERPDILHLNSSKIGALGGIAGRLARVKKIIFTAHGWAFFEDRKPLFQWLIKFISWLSVLFSHTTITVSRKDELGLAGWPLISGKIVCIVNGIRPIEALGRDEARMKLHVEHKIPIEGILIGTIAELHKNKGLSYLIKALTSLPQEILFCIIGDGEERASLSRLIKTLGLENRVILTGAIPNASRFLKTFDIFVLPSIKEGLPYVLLEAGMLGLPVVATNVGGIPEIIIDKKTGLSIEPRNPQAVAKAIQSLLDNKKACADYGSALQKKVVTEFSIKQMLEKTGRQYRT